MGSSPTKHHIKPASITNTPLHKEVKSPGEHPEKDPHEQRQEDMTSSVNAFHSDMSNTDQTGQKSNTDQTGQKSNTDQTGQKDTVLVPVVDQRDQSPTNPSSPSLKGEKLCKHRRVIIFLSRNIYYKITRPKDYKNKRTLLKPFLSSSKIFQLFDHSTRNKCFNSLVCRTIIACPVVLGPRTCSDSGLISHVNGFPWTLMEHEVYRVLTFLCYPVAMAKSPLPLAQSGFVYIGDGETDRIICFFCLKIVENWQASGGFEEFHEVTCRRRMTSEDASMIDMAALMAYSALRPRLPSGSSVGTRTLPEESGPQPNLSQLLSRVRFSHVVGSTADEAPTGVRVTLGAEAALVATRTSVDEQVRHGETRWAPEAATDEEARLTVEAATDEEAILTVEAATDEEARLTVEATTDEETELTVEVEATTDEEAKLTVEVTTEEEAKLTAEATTDEEAKLTVEATTDEEAKLTVEAPTDDAGAKLTAGAPTGDEEAELADETTTDEEAALADETMTDEEAEFSVEATTDALRVELSEGRGPLSGEVRMKKDRPRATEDLSSESDASIDRSRTTETMSPTSNTRSLRRRPSELTNIMEVIREHEVTTILTNFHDAQTATNARSNGRRYSCYSPITRPRMTRRGSV